VDYTHGSFEAEMTLPLISQLVVGARKWPTDRHAISVSEKRSG